MGSPDGIPVGSPVGKAGGVKGSVGRPVAVAMGIDDSSCLSLSEIVKLDSDGMLVKVGIEILKVVGIEMDKLGVLVRVGIEMLKLGMLVKVGIETVNEVGIEMDKLVRSVSVTALASLASAAPVGRDGRDVMSVKVRIGMLKLGRAMSSSLCTTGAAEHCCATRAARTKRRLRAMTIC